MCKGKMSAADNNEFGVTKVLNALWSFSYPAHELKIKGMGRLL
jgi:hypothetical protein